MKDEEEVRSEKDEVRRMRDEERREKSGKPKKDRVFFDSLPSPRRASMLSDFSDLLTF